MRDNTDKHPSRFSPLGPLRSATICNTPPRQTHPRQASEITLHRNAKLFAAQAIDGQGALSSQVSDTQYFNQFEDVSPQSHSSRSPSPTGGFSQPTEASPSADGEHWLFWDWKGENSWDYDAMIDHGSPSPSNVPTLSVPSMPIASTPSPKPEPVQVKIEPTAESAETGEENFTDLSPFEKWVIRQIRDAKNDGMSLADCLRNLKKRYDFLDGMQDHYKRILAEIHMLSKDLF
ncbi:hypothetical protein C8R45DRAFT_1094477 [Mycena sanguinolenta]|nr:hypothetical protein C8R45DRAFT_1094477 [Mycena sanguinolenta]